MTSNQCYLSGTGTQLDGTVTLLMDAPLVKDTAKIGKLNNINPPTLSDF